jgi:hypothetical protein
MAHISRFESSFDVLDFPIMHAKEPSLSRTMGKRRLLRVDMNKGSKYTHIFVARYHCNVLDLCIHLIMQHKKNSPSHFFYLIPRIFFFFYPPFIFGRSFFLQIEIGTGIEIEDRIQIKIEIGKGIAIKDGKLNRDHKKGLISGRVRNTAYWNWNEN